MIKNKIIEENNINSEFIKEAFELSVKHGQDELIFRELPWGSLQESEINKIRDTLKFAGINTILTTDTSTSLINYLAAMQKFGFYIKDLHSYQVNDCWERTVNCIRIELR